MLLLADTLGLAPSERMRIKIGRSQMMNMQVDAHPVIGSIYQLIVSIQLVKPTLRFGATYE